ncbi:MAG: flagellar basal body rod protein FlgB [Leptospirales bacterium]|nr:flagellar basal body rod protein FlgB [Leptospirales bacterium]
MSLFDSSPTIDMLGRGLDAAVLRERVLANNISNVDVPHFKRSGVIFESELSRAIDSERVAHSAPVQLRTSDPRHFQTQLHRDWRDVNPRESIEYSSSMRNDGNNVDIEQEVTDRNKNELQYNLMIERLAGQFRQLNAFTRLA